MIPGIITFDKTINSLVKIQTVVFWIQIDVFLTPGAPVNRPEPALNSIVAINALSVALPLPSILILILRSFNVLTQCSQVYWLP